MVPVSLRLQNFLSYGTAAPDLDFEQFHVACLSGRNGQGKSALLDAITWALWGEARKASDSRKPDDDLLRIGATRMQVELVFDLEGTRYRVVRWYEKSKTGKTTKPGLEVHVYDPDLATYRPLTASSIRETQQVLHGILGLDFETFINSAFLLQGRSDEFTRKRPSERKQILARILNLERYDRLAELARERVRRAEEAMRLAEAEVERLKHALADEPAWKEEHTRVLEALKAVEQELAGLREEEKRAATRLASLEARHREAETLRQSLDSLAARCRADEEERRELLARIQKADELIEQREAIERDYRRLEQLKARYDALLEKQDLFMGIEDQIRRVEAELSDRRSEVDKKLHALAVDRKAMQEDLGRLDAELAELPSARRRLEQARADRNRFLKMKAVAEQRQALDEAIRAAEEALLRERETLRGRIEALEREIDKARKAMPDVEALTKRMRELDAEAERLAKLKAEMEEIRQQGEALSHQIKEREGRQAALGEAVKEQEAALERLLSLEEEHCPTCGTPLTPEHRREIEERYRAELARLAAEQQEMTHWLTERAAERDTLRARYLALQKTLKSLEGHEAERARVEEQLRRARTERDALEGRRQEVARLRQTLEAEAFGEAFRERLARLRARRDALPFDEAAFEQLREAAAGVDHLEERVRRLEGLAGRRDQLTKNLAQKTADEEALRRKLDDGSLFGDLQERLRTLRQQRDGIGFDRAELEEVRRGLRALEKAGERMKELLNARENRAAWKEDVARIEDRLARSRDEQARQETRLKEIEASLAGREALIRQQQEKARACAEAERRLADLQTRSGELQSRLEQAARDRAALREQRERLRDAKDRRALYQHLVRAFGKHGIPSLIIEQTLPEIEERANELLGRLTDGRMSIRLETLKDKKSGGTRETLDIIITDEQGKPRPYETFSGGEAFRVNFALRIALAQLLAERSGVRIRTLVIDEGFGTQDEQGVENMVEAIQAIQNDFDKILVITHLDQLKEAFPVRIEVEKDPTVGSRFQIIGV